MGKRNNRNSRLTFFPSPLPDETVYSLIQRFHKRSGFLSLRPTLNLLFGSHSIQLASDFFSEMPRISDATGIPLTALFEQHSTIPFFRTFSTSKKFQECIDFLSRGEVSEAIATISLLANRLVVSAPYLRYCLSCLKEDIDKYGIGYWHCTHQLPGITCCPIHLEQLINSERCRTSLSIITELRMTRTQISKKDPEYIYAQFASDSFHSREQLAQEKLYRVYYAQLATKGLLTRCGRLRLKVLKGEMYLFWADIFDSQMFRRLNPLRTESCYPECLFYSRNASHHPIKHLLLIGFLFESWADFVKSYKAGRSQEHLDLVPTFIPVPLPPLIKKKAYARRLFKTQRSLTKIAKEVGLTVTTIRSLAESEGIEISTRPKRIYKNDRRTIWRQLLIGKTTKAIASQFSISQSAVEHILSAHPELVPLRRKIQFFTKRDNFRRLLALNVLSDSSDGRNTIRSNIYRCYMWLYKNDKEWLFSHLPKPTPHSYRLKKFE